MSIAPRNNRDLNQHLLHLWSKFGDPGLNGSRVIAQTSKWLTHRLTHTDTHTDAGNDNTRRPNWPRVKIYKNPIIFPHLVLSSINHCWHTEELLYRLVLGHRYDMTLPDTSIQFYQAFSSLKPKGRQNVFFFNTRCESRRSIAYQAKYNMYLVWVIWVLWRNFLTPYMQHGINK